ncbi:MAG: hypothetical protein IKN70_08900 [Fibrobacter sp.]|nr:hypothetical protein [Fibrobacter sp.]
MLYKHWKKIVLALTGFFWASCDETSSSPVAVNEDAPSSSIAETEGVSSSSKAKSTTSSAEETSVASSAERSSSSQAKSAASSAEEPEETSAASSAEETSASSSSKAMSAASSEAASSVASSAESSAETAASNATNPSSEASSSSVKSSSSSQKFRSSSSSLDAPVDLYGCPSDICGPFITDSASVSDSISIIAAKYGVIRPESSSSISEIIAKYGVPSKTTCTVSNAKDGKVTYTCEDGVTCVEETKTEMQAPACNGDVCPKYGVVKISKKTYTCDNGQVYNEAEFQMLYDTLPVIEDVVIKDSIQAPIALYGPPCVFDGTCNKEK